MAVIQHNEIVIPLPPGWKDGTQVVAVCALEEGGFQQNVVISREPRIGDETIEQFAARQTPLLQIALPGTTVVEEGPATLGSLSGYLREHEFYTNNVKVKQLQFYMLADLIVYGFTYTNLAEKFELNRKAVEQMFSQIRIDPVASMEAYS